jgi:hypothetical protein
MMKEYRVWLSGSSQGNYIIAKTPTEAINRARVSRSIYKGQRMKVMLWKKDGLLTRTAKIFKKNPKY